jgi:hypothetical protein
MSLTSINLPLLTLNDLLEISDSVPGPGPNGEIFSALQNFEAIVPEAAFSPQDMLSLKKDIIKKVSELNVADLFTIGNLSSNIIDLPTTQLSAVLFDSGVDVENFSLESFDLSVDGLVDLNAGIDESNNALAGGCEIVLAALATSKSPKELSLESFDLAEINSTISGAATSLVDGISSFVGELTSETIAAQAEKNVADLINDSLTTVDTVTNNIKDELDYLESINISALQKSLKAQEEAIAGVFTSSVDALLGDIPKALTASLSITEGCSAHTSKSTEALVKNLQKNVDALADKVEVSALNLGPTQKLLTAKLDRVKGLVTETQNKKIALKTAAIIKKTQENNPQADPVQIEQTVKNQIAKANKTHDEKIRTERMCISNSVNGASSKYADIQRSSNQRSASSAAAGRPIASKGAVIREVIKWNGTSKLYDASYFNGPYAKDTAKKVNTLHPKVRERFAKGIRDVQNDPKLLAIGYSGKFSYATRTFAQQAALYKIYKEEGGSKAAPAGRSWHNYKCACDLVVIKGVNTTNKKGKRVLTADWNTKWHEGIYRDHFLKYGLENYLKDDSGHFQPAELSKISTQKALRESIKNNVLDENVIATYLV